MVIYHCHVYCLSFRCFHSLSVNIDKWYSCLFQYIAGCDAIACAVCIIIFGCHFVALGNTSPLSFSFLNIVRSIGFWEHCYVWKRYFLVLGNFSCSIYWRNMGKVSCLIDTLSLFMHVIHYVSSHLYGSANYNSIFFFTFLSMRRKTLLYTFECYKLIIFFHAPIFWGS